MIGQLYLDLRIRTQPAGTGQDVAVRLLMGSQAALMVHVDVAADLGDPAGAAKALSATAGDDDALPTWDA